LDINDLLREQGERLVRIETKVDVLLQTRDDHESRIRSNEKWRWGILGAPLAALFSLFGLQLPG
jgi:hypothetical protein